MALQLPLDITYGTDIIYGTGVDTEVIDGLMESQNQRKAKTLITGKP